ncbi:MAG TPA: alpha/beta fold hydrolase [Candidatus Saccharimonadales bacterium]|nr:alpha/beta fold hydrolase [Candidatus Saccharimonadales bacterium]
MEKYRINGVSVTKYNPTTKISETPIIMVHGGDHAGWCWEKWARFFCDTGYEVHAPDWYNHGDSDKLPEDEFIHRSIADVAKKEIAYVAEQFEQAPIVIGHSMGGLAAALYAASSPVERLVLVAPVMPLSVHADPVPLPVDPTKAYPLFPYEQAKELFFTTLPDEEAQRYYQILGLESPQAVYEATRWTVDVDISKITAPTLILAAEFDRLIPNEPLKRYAELLHADYHLIKGIGHSDILLKNPEWKTAAEVVKTWLDKS